MDRYMEAVNMMLKHVEKTLTAKRNEYAVGGNYHNFEKAAELLGITPVQALAGMMSKHTVSVYDLVNSKQPVDMEQWKEKIGDHITYLLILWAMVNER